MSDYITIGEIIRHYRKEAGMSQESLAMGICDRKYLSQLENNQKIPTLYTVNLLSERLGINLYDTYALMLRHHDIETHKKIEILNQHFKYCVSHTLSELIKEYSQLPEFQTGEPAQILGYAKAIYNSDYLHDYDKATDLAQEALTLIHPISFSTAQPFYSLSNIELALINHIGTNHCRKMDFTEGKKYYEFLLKHLENILSKNHYATNKNEQFELKLLSAVTYNYFLFLKNENDFDYTRVDDTLRHLKKLHSHHLLPELLLCKTYLLIQNNDVIAAKETYILAHHMGLYLYPVDYVEHIEKTTLEEKLELIQ